MIKIIKINRKQTSPKSNSIKQYEIREYDKFGIIETEKRYNYEGTKIEVIKYER